MLIDLPLHKSGGWTWRRNANDDFVPWGQRKRTVNESYVADPDKRALPSLGRIRPFDGQVLEIARGLDVLLVVGSLWVVCRIGNIDWQSHHAVHGWLAGLLFMLVGGVSDVYRSWRSERMLLELSRVFGCWVVAAACTEFLMHMLGTSGGMPRTLAWPWFIAALVALSGWRIGVRMTLRAGRLRGHNFRRTAIVGSTDTAQQLAQAMLSAPWMGLKFVGYYDDRRNAEHRVAAADGAEIAGTTNDLVRAALAGQIDRIYIALPMRAELRIKALIDHLSELPVDVLYVPDFFLFNMLQARWEHVGEANVVNVVTMPFLGVSGLTKRLEDIVLSSLILMLIALPLLVIALAVRLDSKGPVLFRQRRYGLNGKEFEIWKFRTMTVAEDGDDFVQVRPNDARVTRLGAFLRGTSLDELPQFINVLRGDMSIVGPRPHPVALDEQHRRLIPQYYFRFKIRPGITGLAQINGFRGPTDTLDKMQGRIQYDIRYIDSWSLMLDLKIVLLTLVRGFMHKNAL